MKDVISIRDLSRASIDSLILRALDVKHKRNIPKTKDIRVASLFYENSTRTRVSSETAAVNYGCKVFGFAGLEGTSVKKGESLFDTVMMFHGYGADAIFLRHPLAGAPRSLTHSLDIPIINCGDGSNGHPTQTLLDLMTIQENHNTIDGLNIAMVGDLKYGRTVHSMLQALELYNVNVTLVNPRNLAMPKWRIDDYERETGKKIIIMQDLQSALADNDVIYMTRIQRERFPEGLDGEVEYKKVSELFKLNCKMIDNAKPDLIVMHPLPLNKRNPSILPEVNMHKAAKYYEQAANGVPMRHAILATALEDALVPRPRISLSGGNLWQSLPINQNLKQAEKLIYRLDDGTLIDHIEQGNGLLVYKILELSDVRDHAIVPALNIDSTRSGYKDVLAIHGIHLCEDKLRKLGLISKTFSVNRIKGGRVVEKGTVLLPSYLEGDIECQGDKCITRSEHQEGLVSKFYVESREPLRVRCDYCEEPTTRNGIVLI